MNTQIDRIKNKLATIENCDTELMVFGADAHEYSIGEVVMEKEVVEFETMYNIVLPEAYKAFITQVGNGNTKESAYMSSAAGPYYGIYPFSEGLEDLGIEDVKRFISSPCLLRADMTEEEWIALSDSIREEGISDEVYNERMGLLFSGLLPIGTQGCAITTCLIINGEYRGKIVYINEDYQPVFAYEQHFLDWYERWLNEIISGDLVSEEAGWFGYSIGGSSEFLWSSYKNTINEKQQLILLEGLLKKKEVSEWIIDEIVKEFSRVNEQVKLSLSILVAKFDFTKAVSLLEELIEYNFLHVLQMIHWYGTDKAYWLPLLKARKDTIEEEEAYRFYTYVVSEATSDYGELVLPGLLVSNPEIRGQAIYTLGKIAKKEQYLDYFIKGLYDENERVVLYSIQALEGMTDDRLVSCYYDVYRTYKESEQENYILINLQHRMKELGLSFKEE